MAILENIKNTVKRFVSGTVESVSNNPYFEALFKFLGRYGFFNYQSFNNRELLEEGYVKNKHINAMINWIAGQTFKAINQTGKYYRKDKEGNLIAFDYAENQKLMNIIKKPYLYDFEEFIKGLVVFFKSEGEFIIYKKLRYDDDREQNPVIAIGLLAPHDITTVGGGTFNPIGGFRHVNFTADFKASEIILKRNFNPIFDTVGSQLRGMSPLKAIENEIQLSKKGIETLGAIANNQGVRAIVSPKVNPNIDFLTKEQTIVMRESFEERTKGNGKQGDLAFMNTEMVVSDLGMKPTELQILEQEDKFIGWFCNTFGLDQHLFGVITSGHDGISKEANKTSITKAVLPMVEKIESAFTEIGQSWYPNEEIVFKCTPTDCFEELKDDLESNAKITQSANGMSINEMRRLLGLEPDLNPTSDLPIVKGGYTFVDEIGGQTNVPPQQQTDGNL